MALPKERKAFFTCAKHKDTRVFNLSEAATPPRYGSKHSRLAPESRNSPCFSAFSNSLYRHLGALVLKAANSAIPANEMSVVWRCLKNAKRSLLVRSTKIPAYLIYLRQPRPRDTAQNIVALLLKVAILLVLAPFRTRFIAI